MNFVQAMKAMTEGKKVRKKNWLNHNYIYLKDDKIYDEVGIHYKRMVFEENDVYELYQEPQEELFQWVFKNVYDNLQLYPVLLTEKRAAEHFSNQEYKKLNDVLGNKK